MNLPGSLFSASILLFFLACACSVLFYRFQRFCGAAVNTITIIASALMAAASVWKLLSEDGTISLFSWSGRVPFLSVDLRVDHLSAVFLLSLAILALCVSVYSLGYISHYVGKRNVGLFYFLYTGFLLSMIFVFTAANAVFFYVVWEGMSILSYFLVVFESEKKENRSAGVLYLVMTHLAAALLLIGFLILFRYTNSFDVFGSAAALPEAAKNAVFLLFLVGFGTKAGVVPLHIWLPYAHPAAPSNVSALMSGVMIKTAIYGLLRFVLGCLGVENTWWGVAILCVGAVSAVLGVAYALVEQNIKRLLAYSSVENIGIILVGLGAGFIALAQHHAAAGALALTAALMHTLCHALFKGGLFLGAGSIQYATHTKDMERLGGLIKKMPVTAVLVLCFSLAISAIVPFNGFISEWLTYQSLFAQIAAGQAGLNIVSILAVASLGLAGALAAACFVKLFGISFLALPRSEEARLAREVPVSMNVGMGMLAFFCLLIGLFPLSAIRLVGGAAAELAGASVFGALRGGMLFAFYPLSLPGGAISPLVLVGALALLLLLTLVGARIVGGRYIERKYGTWDCGYEALNARMQYTATGFSKPIKIVFRILFRPMRQTRETGRLPYFPDSVEYTTTSESVFEKYLYKPLYAKIKLLSRAVKFRVQTGSVHSYLLYIFLTILLLMLYNRLV